MEELVAAEKIGELVLGAAINKLGEYKSKKEWSQLFVNTGEFFLKEVEYGERIIEDISLLLSRENMKELAKKTDEGSKYLLRNTIYTGLKRLMLQYEIPAQSLYEKKLCTYPRTDSQYLSDDMADTANRVLQAVGESFSFLPNDRNEVSVDQILNSEKVTDHHAIIPTVEMVKNDIGNLPDGEIKILSLLATRIVSATADRYQYRNVKAKIDCGEYVFTSTGKTVIAEGFKKYDAYVRRRTEKEDADCE